MSKNLRHHLTYHLSLAVLLLLGIFITLQVSYDRKLQIQAIAATAFLYVAWGIAHHVLEHDVNAKIVIEYILMGVLGLTISVFFIQGAML